VPDGDVGQQAFAVIREAIRQEGMVALAKVVFTSREHIIALEARGKGILLLHDIHPATVAALPELLKQLKERGFHIVHVVPAPAAAPVEMAGAPLMPA